jgi:cobaltochelatase CobN
MQVLIIGDLLCTPAMIQAAEAQGIALQFLSEKQVCAAPDDTALQAFDAILAGNDHGGHGIRAENPILKQSRVVVPMCAENLAAGIGSVPLRDSEKMQTYFAYGGPENLRQGFRLLRRLAGESVDEILPPRPVPLDSIYTAEGHFYESAQAFFDGEGKQYRTYVGILNYRSRWASGDTAVDERISAALQRRGIGTICAYSNGSPDQELGTLPFEEVVDRFFCMDGKPVIGALVNFQFYAARAAEGKDMFAHAADIFTALDIPVIRPVGLARKTIAQWKNEDNPFASELMNNFQSPELQGMIEPVPVFCSGEEKRHVPIPERIERLAGRIERWLSLQNTPNKDKKLAIMLNNAPCSGVEATVGMATDLDAFESAVAILRRLQAEGYTVTDIPENGQALKDLIFERKAISDFRWTAAEEIAAHGGVLYTMDKSEYERYYEQLSSEARAKMEEQWGTPPGEAMVLDGRLLVTGILFGNIAVMVQPKRGCYGAKCTGEVCKILQDPTCPPTHQYLSTYWYLNQRFCANAVIHLGTHGSLEYLPGKSSGLSADCFPDIALGDLVNLYPYHVSCVSQGLMAKRRSCAVTISHLPAPGKGLSADQQRFGVLLQDYLAAAEKDSEQTELLRKEVEKAAAFSPAMQSLFEREPDFDKACRDAQALLQKNAALRKGSVSRTFGSRPDRQWIRDYITELWDSEEETSAAWQAIEDPLARSRTISALIDTALDAPEKITNPVLLPLAEDARKIAQGLLQADKEMDALFHALSGGYVPPTQGGDTTIGGREILPTGRNLHGGNFDRLPTSAAYIRGKAAAEDLLTLYQKQEGKLPEKVAMNMTSLDITRTGGEQLSQMLYLLGVRPRWSPTGRVEGLECIPLAELGRPRIDVTVHISSVMRDAWPAALTMMDRAVNLAAQQEEPEDRNYVRANSRAISRSGENGTDRIFGGQPGTYTSAVGLALKASAWKTEEDLAKYFIDSSSYLYGEEKNGISSPKSFAENVRQVDLTSDITNSRRTDATASSYSARVQGGFKLAAKALGSKKKIRQYMGESTAGKKLQVVSLSAHVEHAIEDTLLNALWKEQIMEEGYSGAADIMCRIQNLFDTQCVCETITSSTLDAVVESYLLDERTQNWFREQNPYALEESGRRFLELHTRGKWQGDPDVLRKLQRTYLTAEGDLEDNLSGLGEIQAGNVDIITHEQVGTWKKRMEQTEELIKTWKK